MIDIKTDFGTIKITKNVFGRIVSEALATYNGELFPSNSKGKMLKLKNASGIIDNSSAIDLSMNKGVIHLRFYMIMRIGMSISAVTNDLINYIKSEFAAVTGYEHIQISIVIKGMYKKDAKDGKLYIAKRNIEVVR